MKSARRPSDDEIIQQETATMAGAEEAAGGAGGKDTSNLADDNEEQAAAHRNRRRKEEEEDARKKKEEAEAAQAAFLECWLRHWEEDVARKKKEEEEEEDAQSAAGASDEKTNCLERYGDKLLNSVMKDWQKWEVKTKDEVDKMRQWLMLLATLAVPITYAAGLSPPGGMWQDDKPGPHGHTAGTPVLQTNDPSRYLTFYYTNAMSFVTSLVIVALLLKRKASVQLLVFVTLFDLLCIEVAYLAGTTSGVRLSIPLVVVASVAFLYVAYGILALVLATAIAVLISCLSLLCLPCLCIAALWDDFVEGRGNRDRGVPVTVTTSGSERGRRKLSERRSFSVLLIGVLVVRWVSVLRPFAKRVLRLFVERLPVRSSI